MKLEITKIDLPLTENNDKRRNGLRIKHNDFYTRMSPSEVWKDFTEKLSKINYSEAPMFKLGLVSSDTIQIQTDLTIIDTRSYEALIKELERMREKEKQIEKVCAQFNKDT